MTLDDGTTLELAALAEAYGKATGDAKTAEEWQEKIKQDYETLKGGDFGRRRDPAQGFMDLDKRLVMALVKAGLSWGGTLNTAKDIMHFDYRNGTIKKPRMSSTA